MKNVLRDALVAILGVVYWTVASVRLNTQEPWDSPDYLPWYLVAVGIAGLLGWVLADHPLRLGALVVFGQLPVMLFQSGIGPLSGLGIGLLALQAVPAGLAASAMSKVKAPWRDRRD